MTSLPVRKLYQHIGEQIDAQIDAVVHIENSIYLRSKAIDEDKDSLKAFLEYSISLLGNYCIILFLCRKLILSNCIISGKRREGRDI